jgi:hypothetical protein
VPSFSSNIANLEAVGPVVEVLIFPSVAQVQQLQQSHQPIPAPVKIQALIDTGASGSCINPAVAESLALSQVGVSNMSTPSTTTPVQCPIVMLDVLFMPNQVKVGNIFATVAPLGGQQIQMLIGRDVLKHGVLIYTGYINQFTLSF